MIEYNRGYLEFKSVHVKSHSCRTFDDKESLRANLQTNNILKNSTTYLINLTVFWYQLLLITLCLVFKKF